MTIARKFRYRVSPGASTIASARSQVSTGFLAFQVTTGFEVVMPVVDC